MLGSRTAQQLPQIFAPQYDKVPKETQSSNKIFGKNNYNTPAIFSFPPVTIAIIFRYLGFTRQLSKALEIASG